MDIIELNGAPNHGDHFNFDGTPDCSGRHCGSGTGCAQRLRDGGSCFCKCIQCLTVGACVNGDPRPRIADLGTLEDITAIVTAARAWHDAVDDCLEGDQEAEALVNTTADALFEAIEESRINPRHR